MRMLDKKENGRWPFEYTPSTHTDIRRTFKEARRRMLEELKPKSVVPLRKTK